MHVNRSIFTLLLCLIFPALCLAAPVLTKPAVENVGADMATLILEANGTGTGYFTLVAGSDAACGTGAQVAEGQDSSGVTAAFHGSLPLAANVAGYYTVRNLSQNTPYTICFTADSPSGSNLNPAPLSVNLTTTNPPALLTPYWGVAGSAGFSSDAGSFTSMAFASDGTPYVAYSDAGNSYKATVMKFDGNNWIIAGNAGFSAGRAVQISLALAPDGTPYVAYSDLANGNRATVMKFDGTMWVTVGGAGFSAGTANFLSLAFFPDGTPAVAYKDVANGSKATMMRFDGTTWVSVGNAGFSDGQADYTSLAFAPDGTPAVAFKDGANGNKATMMTFDGVDWNTMGSAGFTDGTAYYTSLAFAPDGTPAVAFKDGANDNKATVMQFNGAAWGIVGNAGFSAGQTDYTSLAFAPDGTPHVAYEDYANGTMATAMKFDGATWITVGSAGFSAGQADYTFLAFAPDGTPHVVYRDYGNSQKVTVMKLLSVKETSTTTLASNINPADLGQAVTLTATVSPANATGTVTFLDGAASLGTYPITGGSATCTTSALGAGSHSITARYGGDGNYSISTSPALNQDVNKGTSTTTLLSDINPSLPGQLVTFTAYVTNGATGMVTFSDGVTILCNDVPLSGGTAFCSISSLSGGSHAISAAYGGDSNYNGSSGSVLQKVKLSAPITLNAATLNTVYDGTPKVVTATTVPPGLSYSITYNGSSTPPSAIGSYTVDAVITDSSYLGSITGQLIIRDPATPVIQNFTAVPRPNYLIADTTITATDDVGVTGYCITESASSSACTWSANPSGSYTFASAGAKTLYAFVRDAAGNVSSPATALLTINSPILTVVMGGTGSGTVTSNPVGIACTSGICTGAFSGTVTLYATPSALSNFVGWGEDCVGLGTCSITMIGPGTVTAAFNAAALLHIDGTTYTTLQAAYEAATRGAVIQMLATDTAGPLTADKSITVTLKGGYDASYTTIIGSTAITGPLKVTAGKIEADKIVIR